MGKLTDQAYLLSQQYGDAAKLNARIELHRRFSTNARGWMPWVFDQFDLPAEGAVLDVGCGPCDLWAENGDRLPAGWRVALSDFSPGMLRQAQDNLRPHVSVRPCTFWCADAQALPFASDRFDAVVANHMLYHVPDRARAIAEMFRVLKPGGRLYAGTNGQAHMRELREWVARFGPQASAFDAPLGFSLENGAPQLSRCFAEVTLRRYPDGLVVTEPGPFIAYVLSMIRAPAIQENPEPFVRAVEQAISSQGAIRVTKDTGLFIATKAPISLDV